MVHIRSWFMLILIYWVEAYILNKKNTEVLAVVSKMIGLEVNADKTKYLVMSRDQNTARSHSVKNNSSFFERLEEFR
jgi:hypothetical protein